MQIEASLSDVCRSIPHPSSVEASPITVGELMDRLGQANAEDVANWPTPTDVHVHLNRLIAGTGQPSKPKEERIVLVENEDKFGKDGLVSPSAKLSSEKAQVN